MFWIIFLILISSLLAIDLCVQRKRPDHQMTFGESMTWTLVWIGCALLFNFAVYWIYEYGLMGHQGDGKQAALLFFTGYVIEKSLSLDNIFVIALIFSYFQVPARYQHRVLIWGVFGAIVMRMAMILLGTVLITNFTWMTYVFGILLIATAVKMLVIKQDNLHPEKNPVIIFVKKYFPVTHEYHGHSFFVRLKGKWWITPLFLALIVVETSDLIFAIDSIPAIFAITSDPFIVFTSNIFAILGLRSLYFVLATAIDRFYYLRHSMVFLLAYVGVKMLLAHHYPIDTVPSMLIIVGILSVGVIASLISVERVLPYYDQLRQVAVMTVKDLRRIAFLLAGVTILVVGLAMLVLPGPGLLLIPIGLMLLAREFLWARKLLKKLKQSNKTLDRLIDIGEDPEEKN